MKIYEFQAKEMFRSYGIATPREQLCTSPQQVYDVAKKFASPVVIKAQALVGGRGKAGGVKLAKTPREAKEATEQILNMSINNLPVKKVLVAEAIDIEEEYYIGITNDRTLRKMVVMVSPAGGIEIEEVAKATPEKIFKLFVDPSEGLFDFQARNLACKLFDIPTLSQQTIEIIKKLYQCYIDNDATLAEINPLALDKRDRILALDAKINFDDNALFRHPEIDKMREVTPGEEKEIEAKQKGLSYVPLNGEIGCMVNGAGLAMATMDLIKLYGGEPANFLDIGGSSNPQKVMDAMKLLVTDKNVKTAMINIFGGITRCDDVATGLVDAIHSLNLTIPIVIRLTGTNEEKAHKILQQAKNIILANSMADAAKKAIELAEKQRNL
jgi:succinyl-CoA synthetase beta subunit